MAAVEIMGDLPNTLVADALFECFYCNLTLPNDPRAGSVGRQKNALKITTKSRWRCSSEKK